MEDLSMTFKEFKNTEDWLLADVISFVDIYGENCEDIDEVLDNMSVVSFYRNGGYLEIVLD
jgi:hypothetical protein